MNEYSLVKFGDQYSVQFTKNLPGDRRLTVVELIDSDATIEDLHKRLQSFLKKVFD